MITESEIISVAMWNEANRAKAMRDSEWCKSCTKQNTPVCQYCAKRYTNHYEHEECSGMELK